MQEFVKSKILLNIYGKISLWLILIGVITVPLVFVLLVLNFLSAFSSGYDEGSTRLTGSLYHLSLYAFVPIVISFVFALLAISSKKPINTSGKIVCWIILVTSLPLAYYYFSIWSPAAVVPI